MTLVFESMATDSPFLEHVASLRAAHDAVFSVVPDGSWGVVIYRRQERADVYLTGATTRPIPVRLQAGDEILSVSFKPSAFCPSMPPATLLDRAVLLGPAAAGSVWWNRNERVELPTLESAEDFVAGLAKSGLIARSGVVDAVLQGRTPPGCTRTLQRHFLKTTGMTQNYWRQIQRAQKAADELRSGKSLAQVAFESGYADQSHMTRWLKQIIGRTPSEIAHDRGS